MPRYEGYLLSGSGRGLVDGGHTTGDRLRLRGKKMKRIITLKVLIFFSAFLLFLPSCIGERMVQRTETVPPSYTPTQKQKLTISPTRVLAITVVPTLELTAKEAEFSRLMQTNENCSGFCFWGIQSGKTPFSSAVNIFRKFHVIKNIDGFSEGQEYLDAFTFDDQKYYVGLDILQNGEIAEIKDINIRGMGRTDTSPEKWTAFTLPNFLKTNGKPEEILINMGEGPEGRFEYELILKYHDWVAEYYGNQTGIQPKPLVACPLGKYNIQSFRMKPLEKAYRRGTVGQSELTGLSDEEFFKLLLDGSANTCFNLDFVKFTELLNK
jgi:hypothetical protein